eukprot:m.176550 g.176550  ORF g.176550 m.176550 type:complete len:100 (+) comp31849_c6_seq3:2177-2476(+)
MCGVVCCVEVSCTGLWSFVGVVWSFAGIVWSFAGVVWSCVEFCGVLCGRDFVVVWSREVCDMWGWVLCGVVQVVCVMWVMCYVWVLVWCGVETKRVRCG